MSIISLHPRITNEHKSSRFIATPESYKNKYFVRYSVHCRQRYHRNVMQYDADIIAQNRLKGMQNIAYNMQRSFCYAIWDATCR
jgi:hypothetical protein